jgi:3-phosphoshikimate 1-carboxyvinyltransferase
MDARVTPPLPWLAGRLGLPGDKSLGHRLLLLAALREGSTTLENLVPGGDLQATAGLVRALGATVDCAPGCVTVHGPGRRGLKAPMGPIDCGNSGTTARLGLGLLAGLGFAAVLDGDASLRRRPMERVCEPLRRMGARIHSTAGCLPLTLEGGALEGIHYELPLPSAQLKSALLLAGLFARGRTTVEEPLPSRDHTERLLGLVPGLLPGGGRAWSVDHNSLAPALEGLPRSLAVPGDPSSAAFFIAAALALPDSLLEIRGLLLNPGRCRYLDLLQARGARLRTVITGSVAGEPVGDLIVSATPALAPGRVEPGELPSVVDEIPALAALAMLKAQTLQVEGAGELRHKESDRIAEIARVCRAFGAVVEESAEGFLLTPRGQPAAVDLDTGGDHRIAMMASVIALGASGPCRLQGTECIAVSYPGFPFALANVVRRSPVPWARQDPHPGGLS